MNARQLAAAKWHSESVHLVGRIIKFFGSLRTTVAELYDPNAMPPEFALVHQVLARAVDAEYIAAEESAGRKTPEFSMEASQAAFLFERYQALTSLLPSKPVKKSRGSKTD